MENLVDHSDGVFLTEVKDTTLIMTINRPDVRNAINAEVFARMVAAFERLDADPDLRVGVLTGAGGYFSSGMDLKAFVEGESMGDAMTVLQGPGPKKPLIAAIEGFAVAGGLETALVCDLLVAGDDAKFGLPEVRRGIMAAGGGLIKLSKRVPYHQLMELALTGTYVEADKAEKIGLINRCVSPGSALARSIELAEVLAMNSPLGVESSKEMVRAGADTPQAELWNHQETLVDRVIHSADAIEGSRAFLEKRSPRWTGR